MKVLQVTVLAMLIVPAVFADTFVFKSGKNVSGVVLYEDAQTIRIRDTTGVLMSLRKNALAQRTVTRTVRNTTTSEKSSTVFSVKEVTIRGTSKSVAEIARESRKGQPLRRVALLTAPNAPSLDSEPLPKTEQDWEKKIRREEQLLNRLSTECRSAGAAPTGDGVLKTSTYLVDGKKVRVTGYWANPNHIQAAKRVCARAIEAESRLSWIRTEFARFRETLGAK